MKKVLIAVSAFLFAVSLFGVGTVSFAGEKVKEKGTIKSMDVEKGEIVFCPEGTKDEIPIKIDPADLKGIEAGDSVMVQYEKGDVNEATRIKKERKITVPVGC